MTTYSAHLRVSRRRASDHALLADLRIAGTLLFLGGAVLLLGIMVAESLYPIQYTTGGNEISDLGGTRPPAGLVFQPSATIFNLSLMVAGLLVTLSAVMLQLRLRRLAAALSIGVLGLAAFLVGVFPGPTGTPHAVIAMIAFFAGGFAAVFGGLIARPPFRYALVALGLVNLSVLSTYFTLGDASPFWVLGVGGAERLLVWPVLFFLMGFGGYLAGSESESPGSA